MKYQAVIFDLFGTLVENFSQQEYESALEKMIGILQAPHDEFIKMWYQTAGERSTGGFGTLEENLEYICKEIKINPTKNQLESASRVRLEMVARALAPKKDALSTLKQLKSDGYKIGLISNCSPEPPVLWPGTQFAPYFDMTIFSSSAGLRKPDPRIYRMAAEQLSVKPETCLYVGDGDGNELQGAVEVGIRAVLIRNLDEDKANIVLDKPRVADWHGPVITSLKEVLKLL
jgi:putative hydrolase of the HAD superfamily